MPNLRGGSPPYVCVVGVVRPGKMQEAADRGGLAARRALVVEAPER